MRRDKNREFIYKIQVETLSTKPTRKMDEGFLMAQHWITSIAGPHHEKLPGPLVAASPPLTRGVEGSKGTGEVGVYNRQCPCRVWYGT